MSNNKGTERVEWHKTIWRIANALRGIVDGWDFKSYVLGMQFYYFISESLTHYLNKQEADIEGSSMGADSENDIEVLQEKLEVTL